VFGPSSHAFSAPKFVIIRATPTKLTVIIALPPAAALCQDDKPESATEKNQMRRPLMAILTAYLFLCTVIHPSPQQSKEIPSKQLVLTQATQSYYNLRTLGLGTFQCTLSPNWDAVLKEEKAQDPAGADTAIKVLNQLHFIGTLGEDGKMTVTHNDLSGQNQQMVAALQQIYSGMEQLTTGFFETWSLFMLNHPFPEAGSEYNLESIPGEKYRVSYKEGDASVATTMDHDYAITELKVTTADFTSTIVPQFTKSPKGFILSSYTSDYQTKNPAEATKLKVLVDYKEVEGLTLVQNLNVSGTYGPSPFAIEIAFSACQVTKKPDQK
jgi:hypothetical protein